MTRVQEGYSVVESKSASRCLDRHGNDKLCGRLEYPAPARQSAVAEACSGNNRPRQTQPVSSEAVSSHEITMLGTQ
jgi:hypothetical protein